MILDEDPKRAERRPLLFFLIITGFVGAAGSVFTAPEIPAWYASLRRPAIAPPDWVYAPVWTTLYIIMAVAAWRVWRKVGSNSLEMKVFAIQLALNLAWCIIFFGQHQISAGLIEIGVLNLAILAAAILFFRRDALAGLLFLPYLGWTLFSALLNYAYWQLNR